MRKLLGFILAAMLLIAVPGLTVYGADIIDSGTCGDNVIWTLSSDGTLTISGTGDMNDGQAWDDYCWNIVTVIIEPGVTSIGERAFDGCTFLTGAAIPDGVVTIGDYAFCGCQYLADMSIPDSVTGIGDFAFFGCQSLKSLNIPESVTSIGEWAFGRCTGLAGVSIPSGIKSISKGMFEECYRLKGITIPDSVTAIGDYAFSECAALTSVAIPGGVTVIGEGVFKGCIGLTGVSIPNGVTSIGYSAFAISGLTSIIVPDSVTAIGDYAFYRCDNLESVDLGSGVTSIGEYAFANCYELADVYYGGSKTQWNAIVIEDFNEFLLNATIHYGIVDTEITGIIAIIRDGALQVSLDAENVPEGATVYVAAYDGDGKLTAAATAALEDGSADAGLPTGNVAVVRAYIWTNELAPLCPPMETEVVEL